MPIYEYACNQCGHALEANQKFSDPPLTQCPACGNSTLERLVSRSSFALKGSGWYADGYGAKGEKEPKKATTPTPAPDATKTEAATTKTEAAPAPAPAPAPSSDKKE